MGSKFRVQSSDVVHAHAQKVGVKVPRDIKMEEEDKKAWRFMDDFWFDVTFIYRRHDAKSVFLTGDFCGWRADVHAMQPCEEGFSVTLPLSEGFYSYKFFVDGEWVADEHNPHRSANCDNSLMFVHMDPSVYGPREQHPPHRDFNRAGADGGQFQVLCPPLPGDIASCGIMQRLIFVYLPPSYFTAPQRKFPVLYANDGQNIFSTPQHMGAPNGGGWYLDAKLDHFWSQGELPEFILVGVPNSDFVCIGNRPREYCTRKFSDTTRDPYTRFLIEVVKKEIDSKYRTLPERDNTFILGASMGGLQAFITGLNQSDVFSAAICISPAFWYVDSTNSTSFNFLKSSTEGNAGAPPCRLYIDSGDCVTDNRQVTKLMHQCLLDNGWDKGKDFLFHMEPAKDGADMHAEWAWRERVHSGLKFIFKM